MATGVLVLSILLLVSSNILSEKFADSDKVKLIEHVSLAAAASIVAVCLILLATL